MPYGGERPDSDAEQHAHRHDHEERLHALSVGAAGAPYAPPMRRLVVKCTAGTDEPERCNQAFTVAAAAVAAGAEVSLWLTGEAAWLGVPGRAEEFRLELAGSLADSRDLVLEHGRLVVCSQCAARRGITEADLVEGARIAGAAAFAEEVLADEVQALVY
jgi:predicted peroxiredoxin